MGSSKGRDSQYWQERMTNFMMQETSLRDFHKDNIRYLDDEHKLDLVNSAKSEEIRRYILTFISEDSLLNVADDESQYLSVRIAAIKLLKSTKPNDMHIANLICQTKEAKIIQAGAKKLQDEEAMYTAICSSNVSEEVKISLMMKLTENMEYIVAIARNEELASKVRILALNSGICEEIQKDIARATSDSDIILFVLDYNMKDDEFLSEMEIKGGIVSDRAKSLKRRNKRRKKF